jgi:IS605 OrfB family transposase
MDKRMQGHEAYRLLPAKVAQQVLKQLDKNWRSFFRACKEYEQDPSKFLGPPKIPKYKHKTRGRNLLVYTDQAVSKEGRNLGLIRPSMLPIEVKTKQKSIAQVRIVPQKGFYVVEVIYEHPVHQAEVNPTLYAGVDLGVNNLAAITSNKPGFVPVIVNGRPAKSINQYYNKRRADLQKKRGSRGKDTRRMECLTIRRNRRLDHFLHTASRQIIDLLLREGIGTLVVGKNDGWKQEVNMGKRNNQNFVFIPHSRFIDMLTYKAELVAIRVIVTEEGYTSKASFLDLDDLPIYDPDFDPKQQTEGKPRFSGKRVKRGLYLAADGRSINADVNGAYNIIRKVAPEAFAEGVEGAVVHPVRFDRKN